MSSFSLDNSAHFIVNELRVSKDFQNYTILGTLGEGILVFLSFYLSNECSLHPVVSQLSFQALTG